MKNPKTLTTQVPYWDIIDLIGIDIYVSVTYQPRPGCPDDFSHKRGCWLPGEEAELEVISVDYIPGSKLDDMSLWSRIEAAVRDNLKEDCTQLWEHFNETMADNADRRDEAQAERTNEHPLLR